MNNFDNFTAIIASGLGLGYLPILPGTAGALGGVFLSLALSYLQHRTQVLVVLVFIVLAVPICEIGSAHYGGGDAPRIVADELLAFPVTTITLPIRQHTGLLISAFVISRVLDGIKPPPARAAEYLPGGLGIVIDDVVTNAWTLLFVLIGWRWRLRRLYR